MSLNRDNQRRKIYKKYNLDLILSENFKFNFGTLVDSIEEFKVYSLKIEVGNNSGNFIKIDSYTNTLVLLKELKDFEYLSVKKISFKIKLKNERQLKHFTLYPNKLVSNSTDIEFAEAFLSLNGFCVEGGEE